ncbi:MAG: TonB-dependent receptor, partial [Proteobacteria bacterium]
MMKFSSRKAQYRQGALGSMFALVLVAPVGAQAQEAGRYDDLALLDDGPVLVVTGSRSGEGMRIDQIGGSVTVLDAATVEQRETRLVADLLRDVPGIAVSRAVSGLTQVRIRGSEGNQVMVLVDGMKANDPYQGEFDFNTLIAEEASRIEVLRGQQSSLYGSDAIGGVINYTTLSGREAPGYRARAEAGSFGTYNGALRVAGASDTFDYALSGAVYHTAGFPSAPGGRRNIGTDNLSASAKVNWIPTDNFRVTGVARYGSSVGDTNDQAITADSPFVRGRQVITLVDTPGSFYESKAWNGLLKAELDSFDGMMTTALSGQISDNRRDSYVFADYAYGNDGTRYIGSLVNTLRFGSDRVKHSLTMAVDLEREDYRNTSPTAPDQSVKQLDRVGFVGQYNLVLDDRLSLGGSVRHDDNDYFKNATTWRAEASYLLPTGTRLRGAAGSGIKNPTSSELFGYYDGLYIGNPDLQPEESRGWEVGADQSFADGALKIGATYFNNRLTNEIYTDYPAPDYVATTLNRDTVTRQQGVEVFAQARLGDFSVDANYTWLDAPQFRTVLLVPEDLSSFATGPV